MTRSWLLTVAVTASVVMPGNIAPKFWTRPACLAASSAPQGCNTSCYPPINWLPPSNMTMSVSVVSGSATTQQLNDFIARLNQASDGWEGEFNERDGGVSISVDQGSPQAWKVEIDANLHEGDAFTTSNSSQGTMHVPLEWLTDPNFSADYVKTVLAHEVGHFLGFGQSNCQGASIMSDTTVGSYRWFTNCDGAFMDANFQSVSCDRQPPCGQEEFQGGDGCCYSQYGSPILIPLFAGAVDLSGPRDGVAFDIFGAGVPMRVAWPVTPATQAWLALDRNADGRITSGRELFGTATKRQNGDLAANGFIALSDYDVNGDNRLDANDPIFAELRLWTDTERDGISTSEELHPLSALGIESIDLNYRASGRTDSSGNLFRYRSQVGAATAPMVRFAYDVYLAVRPIQ